MKVRLFTYLMLFLSLSLIFGCEKEDLVLTKQRSAIEQYLTKSHQPKLVSAKDTASLGEPTPQYYDAWGQDTYRYIRDMYKEGRDALDIAEKGDVVYITFIAYIFSGTMMRNDDIYFTNDTTKIEVLKDSGLTLEYWSEEPFVIKLGHTNTIKGLEKALVGCRDKDVVEVYMTYESAYGNKEIGIVPKGSSVAWIVAIDSLKKSL